MNKNELENRVNSLELELKNLRATGIENNLLLKNRYHLLFENSPNGFAYCQMIFENNIPADFIFLDVNKAFENLTGLRNVAGLKVTDVIPDIKEKKPEIIQLYGTTSQTGEPQKSEIFVKSLGLWLSVSAICPEKGYFIATIIDITEHKKAEELMQHSQVFLDSIIEHSPNSMWISDEHGTLLRMNQACREKLNLKDGEVVGKYNILKDNIIESQGFMPLVRDVYEKKSVVRFITTYDTSKVDGLSLEKTQRLVLDVNISPIVNLHGKVTNAIIQHIDITERIEAELKIQEQNQILIKLNADKDRFISILGHDLKGPFNSILGFLALLSDNIRKYDIDKIEKQLTSVNKAAQHVYNLLEDILLWARAESGLLSFEPRQLNVKIVFDDILEIVQPNANAKNITIHCFVDEQTSIFADMDMLRTILINLISNAIKFTEPGGKIEVKAELNSSHLTIIVSDNGIGISIEQMDKLFDISQRYSTIGTQGETGTGIGLLLCKEFIEKHGGKIWVESKEGKGSDFKFTLKRMIEQVS